MRHKCALLTIVVSIFVLMLSSANAQSVDAKLESTLTDHLASKVDVKWYSFEMSEPGDAIITIRGLQDKWDGWTTHWNAVIYAPDLQTILAEKDVRGYNGNEYSPPAEISLLGLDSGTYYIKISNTSRNHFTADPYQLELTVIFSSTQPYVSSKGEMYTIGTEPFLDRLISEDQVLWYKLQMAEAGDVVILATGLQEKWDGAAYHWRCAVYRDDLETVITYADVRGYSVNYGPSVLSAPDLEAGTYYVRMTSTSSVNPLMTAYTSAPYELWMFRYYHSASAAYDGDGYQTFRSSGDILWTLDGTAFLKRSDGECFGALMETRDGAIVPILVSTDKAAVEYIISDTGKIVTAAGPWHDKDSDTDYYYSNCEYIDRYTDSIIYTSSLPVLYVNANHSALSAAKQVISATAKEQTEEESSPGFHIPGVAVAGGVFALIVIAGLLLWNGKSDTGVYQGTGSYTSGGTGSDTYSYADSSGSFDHRLHDDLDAVRHAMDISKEYGEDWIGYDAEAPISDVEALGPDPESFPDSSDIW